MLGIVGNGTAQMAYSRAVSSWFDRRRGMALALMMCGGAVGAMVLPPLGRGADPTASAGAAPPLTLGPMVLVIGVPTVALFIRERPRARPQETPIARTGATVGEGLTSRVFWILVIVLFFSSDRAERRHRAPVGAAHRPRRLGRRRRAGALGDGRREPGWDGS